MNVSVRDTGARGDRARDETTSFQTAIDRVHAAGGGRVDAPAGDYLVSAIQLKDGVELRLERGCTLWANHDGVYPTESRRRVIWAQDARRVALTGPGVIDCQGKHVQEKTPPKPPYDFRAYVGGCYAPGKGPSPVFLGGCRDSRVRDVTLRNSTSWTLHLRDCEDSSVSGVTIRNSVHTRHTDGIDIENSRRIVVEKCDIVTGDDAICIKCGPRSSSRAASDIAVRDCTVASETNGLKIGTETFADISRVTFERIRVRAHPDGPGPFGGLSMEMNDGCALSDVTARDIVMQDVRAPVFVKLNKQRRPQGGQNPAPGSLRGVRIEKIRAECGVKKEMEDICSSITGYQSYVVEDVVLRDIQLIVMGGKEPVTTPVPDPVGVYSESRMFGVLPCYGLYMRNVRGVRLEGISVRTKKPDARPAFIATNVEGLAARDLRGQDGREEKPGG